MKIAGFVKLIIYVWTVKDLTKKDMSLSYFDCKGECHDRDENIENIVVGEIKEVNEEEDAISIEKHCFFLV